LTEYLESLGAFQRIFAIGMFTLDNIDASGTISQRDADKLRLPLLISFLLGVNVGLLDQLGELPPTLPPRLS
jgi:hypothetical protein